MPGANRVHIAGRGLFSIMKMQIENDHILSEGKYIAFRQYYNYFINLYLWQEKFYEVWYFRPTNVIE